MKRTGYFLALFFLCILLVAGKTWAQTNQPEQKPSSGQKPSPEQQAKPAELSPAEQKLKNANRVVLRVGKEEFRASEVDQILETLPPQTRAYFRTVGRRQFADYVVAMKALTAEAERLKLGGEPTTRFKLEVCRESVLADAARFEIETTVKVTPEEIEQYYKEHQKDIEQAHVRHIRIRAASSISSQPDTSRAAPIPTDEEAEKKLEDLRNRILKGEDFAELAREHSDDLETVGTGGDIGWINRGEQMPLDYAFTLDVGQLSAVIRGPYGFELLRVEGKRVPPLDDLRIRIELILRNQKVQAAVAQLRDALHPVIDEEYFKPVVPQHPQQNLQLQIAPAPPTR